MQPDNTPAWVVAPLSGVPAAEPADCRRGLWPALRPFPPSPGCGPALKEKSIPPMPAARSGPLFVPRPGLPELYPVPFYHHALI